MVVDDSISSNDGPIYGEAAWTNGKIGGALRFDGIDDCVTIPDHETLRLSLALTVMVWVYPIYDGGEYYVDLVVAKGMGYAETLTELELPVPHALLLRSKCGTVANHFKVSMMAVITPDIIKDLTPKDGYFRVPREANTQGENRIRIMILASETKLETASTLSGGI